MLRPNFWTKSQPHHRGRQAGYQKCVGEMGFAQLDPEGLTSKSFNGGTVDSFEGDVIIDRDVICEGARQARAREDAYCRPRIDQK